eukprot:CAMPEP_0195012694 /NCGR_PEP_ID=MMETSP0326_2-20130528/12034_1 /TAXON_ID=2866 ORGANISM="Crypthecodinium cohnii, Strain Seligo" /NCGR_SAMPLE_ID=MMETSP0326_2 /ASSEMBLY_ACC=CAM_ASM_000348 /LENGTH=190 /DNA_ID=CAMNT_0040022455 /DNA_START=39 /DNA_END=612 /DNA_ORIENTATION=-
MDTKDLGSNQELKVYEYKGSDDYLMLGHSCSEKMTVAKLGPNVKAQTGWCPVWSNSADGKTSGPWYDIFIPVPPEGFMSLGVVCVFKQDQENGKPPASLKVAVVHKDCVQQCAVGGEIWCDAGSRARHDVTLSHVPKLNVMWPSKMTLVAGPPFPCNTLKDDCMNQLQLAAAGLFGTSWAAASESAWARM